MSPFEISGLVVRNLTLVQGGGDWHNKTNYELASSVEAWTGKALATRARSCPLFFPQFPERASKEIMQTIERNVSSELTVDHPQHIEETIWRLIEELVEKFYIDPPRLKDWKLSKSTNRKIKKIAQAVRILEQSDAPLRDARQAAAYLSALSEEQRMLTFVAGYGLGLGGNAPTLCDLLERSLFSRHSKAAISKKVLSDESCDELMPHADDLEVDERPRRLYPHMVACVDIKRIGDADLPEITPEQYLERIGVHHASPEQLSMCKSFFRQDLPKMLEVRGTGKWKVPISSATQDYYTRFPVQVTPPPAGQPPNVL